MCLRNWFRDRLRFGWWRWFRSEYYVESGWFGRNVCVIYFEWWIRFSGRSGL